ncbi:gamma-glutamyl-gamma-aminobutyrate hydrolase family protein [Nocardioides mangrovicus]|uniref:Gamma-glutamyl-gamma-aminobutyrate hydrolase family protein n=1 Tax=Nocardioides mangrovicus TaxID=2478913 RepID=A0A3L8P2V3_9ACTN|nr:gamma-glutamyl-gamma-aminobutyrate hydrolase family protein [Nocardioides mangrovicus]RLV49474.1 gamma-glutamyl-gamma-aminobutyrate hydrolase family protein [Nocardioides mangrovicus]
MTRPLIGISTYREEAAWGVWRQRADLLPTTYADAVALAGGTPVLLPPTAPFEESAADVVARLDALVVAGGADVASSAYGELPHPRTGPPRADRDAWELSLLDAAVARDLPVLGVCRGMQVMAVHAGGVLDQHLPDLVGTTAHDPGGDSFGEVEVQVAAESLVGRLLGSGTAQVSCHHHQAVRSHPGYTAVAWADDGTVEAMERGASRFRLGVQWHPEVVADVGLFRGLVEAARAP